MARRYDVETAAVDKLKRTPQGGVIVSANISRTGVLEYTLDDGTVRREFRPASEVFAADSLASLRGVVVTDRHPNEEVNASNFQALKIGNVDGPARTDAEKFVTADLNVERPDAVKRIGSDADAADALVEVSAGYDIDLDETPGVTDDGEEYDAVQRNIRFNHVALGPRDWGRSGPEVALRLDGGIQRPEGQKKRIMKIIKIDGVDYEFGSEPHIAKLDSDADAAAEKAKTDTEELQKKLDEVLAENAELKKSMKSDEESEEKTDEDESSEEKTDEESSEEKTDEDEESSEKKTDAFEKRVAARVALEKQATAILGGEFKADGKSDRDVMIEAIVKNRGEFKSDGKSDDYITGIFETIDAKSSGTSEMFKNDGGSAPRSDSIEQARTRNEERSQNAWKGSAQ